MNRQRSVRMAIRPLETFLLRVKKELGVSGAEVTVALVSDREIARMNETYRKKKGATDVLSFPAQKRRKLRRRGAEYPERRRLYLGDIAIAPKTARRNAMQLARPLASELRILILHGVLHLLGYDHETDRGEMERFERRLRRKLGIA